MDIFWTSKAQDDLERLYRFANQYSKSHADTLLDRLVDGVSGLAFHPRLGGLVTRFEPKEVRRLILDDYEIHYEIRFNSLYIADLWHTKEER